MTIRVDAFVLLILGVLLIYFLNFVCSLLLILFDYLSARLMDLMFHQGREVSPLVVRDTIVSTFIHTSSFMIVFFFVYWYLHFREVGL